MMTDNTLNVKILGEKNDVLSPYTGGERGRIIGFFGGF